MAKLLLVAIKYILKGERSLHYFNFTDLNIKDITIPHKKKNYLFMVPLEQSFSFAVHVVVIFSLGCDLMLFDLKFCYYLAVVIRGRRCK